MCPWSLNTRHGNPKGAIYPDKPGPPAPLDLQAEGILQIQPDRGIGLKVTSPRAIIQWAPQHAPEKLQPATSSPANGAFREKADYS